MPIVVEVKAPGDYAKWAQAEKAKMPPPESAPQQVAAAAPGDDPNKKWTVDELKTKGEQVYAAQCVACHQATGKGLPPAFPPLAGSRVVNGPKTAQVAIVLKGKPGTAMASFAQLTDVDLAAVITHTRSAWGNKGDAVMPAEIKAARK